jgi:fission process protein 1
MAKDNKSTEEKDGVPVERASSTRPDFSIPPARKRLPQELQDTLNDEEKLWEVLYDGGYVSFPPLVINSPPQYRSPH